jgi:AraC-like DNA-binding protein
MKAKIPTITIEEINSCDKNIKMNVDIRRLEEHIRNLGPNDFPHRHDFYNLIYIKKGSGTHDIDFRRFNVEPAQMFFMNDGQVHEWNLSSDTVGYTLFFKKEFYEVLEKNLTLKALPFFNNSESDTPFVVFEQTFATLIENIFEQIIAEFRTEMSHKESLIKILLKSIFIYSIRAYQPTFNGDNNSLNIAKIRNFENLIETNYKELKSVKDYAARLNISANYLNVVCKETVGKTAGDIIRDRIILETKRLLLHSTISVCEAAYFLGYDDCSYFIRLFKKNVGLSPEKFRAQSRQPNFSLS